jgi:hypothetical protein
MDERNKFIGNIYTNVINIILNSFENEYQDIVKSKYYKILMKRYSSLDINQDNYDKLYNRFLKLEIEEWSKMPLNTKKNIFIKDVALEEMINISNQAFQYALDRARSAKIISDEIYNKSIDRLKELYMKVKDYNRPLAQWYLSEGTMDLDYASGKTKNTSLRLGKVNNNEK